MPSVSPMAAKLWKGLRVFRGRNGAAWAASGQGVGILWFWGSGYLPTGTELFAFSNTDTAI